MAADKDAEGLLREVRRSFLGAFIYALFVSFFLSFTALISPLFMIQVYSRVIPARSVDTLYGLLLISALGVVVLALLDFARTWTFSVMAHNFVRKINLPGLEAGVMRSIRGGVNEGGNAIRDIAELRQFISGNALAGPLDAVWSLVFLVALYLLHPLYAYVAAGFIAFMIVLNLVTDALTRSVLADAATAQTRHVQDVANSLRHAEVIEAMGMLPAFVDTWRVSEAAMLDQSATAAVRTRFILAISKSVQKSIQIIVVATGALLVLWSEASSSVLFAGMVLTSSAVAPFASVVENWRQWVSASEAWKRIRRIIEEDRPHRQTMPATPVDGDLVVDNLVYLPEGAEIPVLKGLSFSLSPGQVLGIAGPSGAGKSTLARCLTGIVKPTAGGVYLDGHSTYLWERKSFGKAVGYLPQNLAIIDGTIFQTIARMQDADPASVVRAARLAGIHDIIGRLPFGYDTPVREGLHILSGGQLQRLALARALFGDPKLIILDEPNSNLDTVGEHALMKAVSDARQRGAIVIMIAHRPSVMAVADLLMVVEDGRVTQFGPQTDVIKQLTGDVRRDGAGKSIPPAGRRS